MSRRLRPFKQPTMQELLSALLSVVIIIISIQVKLQYTVQLDKIYKLKRVWTDFQSPQNKILLCTFTISEAHNPVRAVSVVSKTQIGVREPGNDRLRTRSVIGYPYRNLWHISPACCRLHYFDPTRCVLTCTSSYMNNRFGLPNETYYGLLEGRITKDQSICRYLIGIKKFGRGRATCTVSGQTK